MVWCTARKTRAEARELGCFNGKCCCYFCSEIQKCYKNWIKEGKNVTQIVTVENCRCSKYGETYRWCNAVREHINKDGFCFPFVFR
jgi:hypothetical protein